MATGKVLFVDDEPAVLEGYRRLLHREIPIDTAVGGLQGLGAIVEHGPYAVVVSDMRMPQLSGVQFLSRVRKTCPDTVRIALTGYADMETASKAVNEGNIFRFLTKPCNKETLLEALNAGLVQHRLVVAERELLQTTLRSSIQVLSELLSFSYPAAFGVAMRLQHCVAHVVTKLKKEAPWRYEVAAMLSQLGCVTLRSDTVNAIYEGKKLLPEEQAKYDAHPMVAWEMLARIPRMEEVAAIIAHQNAPATQAASQESDDAQWGSMLLYLLTRYDRLMAKDAAHADVLTRLRDGAGPVELQILEAMTDLDLASMPGQIRTCEISRLATGMVLQEDIRSITGTLFLNTAHGDLIDQVILVPRGEKVTFALIRKLEALAQRGTIATTVRVQIPTSGS